MSHAIVEETRAPETLRARLTRLYRDRDGRPVYFSGAALTHDGLHAFRLVSEAWSHGIPRPEGWDDVHRGAMEAYMGGLARGASDALHHAVARLDAVLVVRLWQLERAIHEGARQRDSEHVATRLPIDRLASELVPRHEEYERLRGAYMTYLEHARAGRLAPITEMPAYAIRRGKRHDAVPALRQRLAHEGFGRGDGEVPAEPRRLDRELWSRLKRYQLARGLEATGRVDRATRELLAQPAQHWLRRLELGLMRWHVGDAREADHIRVNIPQFEVQLVEDGRVVDRYAAVVGKTYWRTPITMIEMGWIFIRPTWFGRGEEEPVPPGPSNPLGPLVIRGVDLSNLIYLHGTNRPELFRHAHRTFSRGCIRLKDPAALAQRLLDLDGVDSSAIDLRLRLEKRAPGRVALDQPVSAWFVYNTTFVGSDEGVVHFARDVYKLDRQLLAAAALQPLVASGWHAASRAARRSDLPLGRDDLAGPAPPDVEDDRQ